MEPIRPVLFVDGRLSLIDQRLLPAEERRTESTEPEDVARAIRDLVVRGAPAIGIAAAFGVALAARKAQPLPAARRRETIEAAAALLRRARPTAVNLAWAVDRMVRVLTPFLDAPDLAQRAEAEAQALLDEDIAACERIGWHGAALLPHEATILTHCNAGALATGGYGTALGVIRAAVAAGKTIHVLACETRPFLQGARLTAWELHRDGIEVTLLTDGMAGHLLARGEIDCAVVGADRIARNGDVANKIGTYTHAVLCREHDRPFYVAAPRSTFDDSIPDGMRIPIEERSSDEVTFLNGMRLAPEGVTARHPAFDVTPARLITAIVTENGVVTPAPAF